MSDLTHVISRLKNQSLDPIELARLAALWQPDVHPPFVEFLAAHTGTVHFAPEQSEQVTPPDEGDLPHPADSTIDGQPAKPVVPTAGTRGGRYAVTSEHRSGGLGTVWRAWDPVLGREVAVKTVRPGKHGPPTPSQLTRFIREARTAGKLEHPCIVPVYDLVERDPAGPCYVMRFVSGRTLSEAGTAYHKARQAGTAEPLDLALLLDAFVAVCRAVAYAHSRGVLHRDLKGQNVVLGEFGEVFLVDWGLAKEAGSPPSGSGGPPGGAADTGPETAHGSLIGTPSFMAPEVASGGPADRVSDVYSLGAMLYQLLTGHPPYEGPDPKAIVNAVAAGEPKPVRVLNPSAPAALASVCATAMHREAVKRYATADALALDVKRWLAGEPVGAHPERLPARAARWANRHRTGVGVGLAVLLTAVGGLSVSMLLLAEEQRRTAAARDAAEANYRAALLLFDTQAGLIKAIETGRDVRAVPPRREQIDRLLENGPLFAHDPAVRVRLAELHWYLGNLCRHTGDGQAAERAFAEAVRLWDELAAADPSPTGPGLRAAAVRRDYAVLLRRLGRLDAAGRQLALARAAADPAAAAGRPRTAGSVALVAAEVDRRRGQADEARRAADTAVRGLAGPDDPKGAANLPLALAYAERATVAADAGRGVDAARDWEQAVAACGPPADDTESRHVGLVVRFRRAVAAAAGQVTGPPATAADWDAAVAGWTALADAHPEVTRYRLWLGVALRERAARGGPPADLDRSVAAFERLAKDDPATPEHQYELGLSLAARGRRPGADPADAALAADALRRAAAGSPEDVIYQRAAR